MVGARHQKNVVNKAKKKTKTHAIQKKFLPMKMTNY
jgi:ribosomal protein S2